MELTSVEAEVIKDRKLKLCFEYNYKTSLTLLFKNCSFKLVLLILSLALSSTDKNIELEKAQL